MSTDLKLAIFVDRERFDFGNVFEGVAAVINDWAGQRDTWCEFSINRNSGRSPGYKRGPITTADLVARIRATSRDPVRLAWADTRFPCLIEKHGEFQSAEGSVSLSVSEISKHKPFPGEEQFDCGCKVHLHPWQSYSAHTKSARTTYREPDSSNRNVESNIDNLIQLFVRLANGVQPSRIYLFLGDCEPCPINSHLSYYSSPNEVIRDLTYLNFIWEHGIRAYSSPIPPLKEMTDFNNSIGQSRPDESRRVLWRQLRDGLPFVAHVTAEDVMAALDPQRMDFIDSRRGLNRGFAVMNYPYVLDAFVDRFILDILDYVAERVSHDRK